MTLVLDWAALLPHQKLLLRLLARHPRLATMPGQLPLLLVQDRPQPEM
jgi:hypothetical protein